VCPGRQERACVLNGSGRTPGARLYSYLSPGTICVSSEAVLARRVTARPSRPKRAWNRRAALGVEERRRRRVLGTADEALWWMLCF